MNLQTIERQATLDSREVAEMGKVANGNYAPELQRKGCVYVLEIAGRIKIGVSTKPESRIETISKMVGITPTRQFISKECNNYHQIEKMMHKHFRAQRIEGEWFLVSFKEAVSLLKRTELDTSDIYRNVLKPECMLDEFDKRFAREATT